VSLFKTYAKLVVMNTR